MPSTITRTVITPEVFERHRKATYSITDIPVEELDQDLQDLINGKADVPVQESDLSTGVQDKLNSSGASGSLVIGSLSSSTLATNTPPQFGNLTSSDL